MKIKLIVLITIFFLFPFPVLAVSASQSAIATKSANPKDQTESSNSAKDLVNKITDKVSQMGQSLKKAYSGKIRSLGNNTISLTHDQGEVFIETNDATNFYKVRAGQRTSGDFKSLKIGTEITVIGIYDEGAKTLVARTLIDKIRRYAVFGKVNNIQKDLVTITLSDGTNKIVDLKDTLVFKKLSAKKDIVIAKQADIGQGDHVSVIGYYLDGETNLTGLKVLILQQDVLNPPPTPTATPSGKTRP